MGGGGSKLGAAGKANSSREGSTHYPGGSNVAALGGKILAEAVLREDRSRSKWEAVEVGMAGEEDRASKMEDSEEQRPQRPGRQWPQEECSIAAWP